MNSLRPVLKVIETIVLVGILLVTLYMFRDVLYNRLIALEHYYLPCAQPISYSIGTLDPRFGISQKDFLKAIAAAEAIWEKPAGRQLFVYKANGHLVVNLKYDSRQATTVKLKAVGGEISTDRATLDSATAAYDQLMAQYTKDKQALIDKTTTYQSHVTAYEAQVSYWNARGGAPAADFAQLSANKATLDSERQSLDAEQSALNATVDVINSKVATLKALANEFNIDATKYNTIGRSQGTEFDEGLFESGPDGESITIYQYDNYDKLVRVLAHELGHALGLQHVNDPKAIMYYLNQGTNDKPTATDVAALKALCSSGLTAH